MGRMADARKRARRADSEKATGAPLPPEPAPPAAGGEARPPSSTDSERGPSAGAPRASRIELPSSGLASDVLSRPEAAAVPAEPPPDEPPAPEPSPPPAPFAAGGEAGAHSLSFFAAPAQEHRVAAEATEHLATFFLDLEEYGVDVRQVQEIRRVGEITTVPRAPDFVRGVINLRGRILPVLDLKRKLAIGEVAIGRSTRIVVVRVRERLLGLLVDGASQVLKVPVSRVEAAPEEVTERGGDYIRGVAKLDDRLIILIDLGRALAREIGEAGVAAGA